MIHRQVWIAIIFGLLTPALSQQNLKTPIVIQVLDETGARIPKAQIEVNTSEGFTILCSDADDDGKAKLDLPVGNFLLSVRSQGFCPQKRSLEVPDQQPQTITAKLRVDACPGPCEPVCVAVSPISPRPVEVIVEDQSGARIPGATIQVRTSDRTTAEAHADCSGQSTLWLDPGKYTVLLRAPGFRNYSQIVDLAKDSPQVIKAVLKIADMGSGYPLNELNVLEPQRAVLDDPSIHSVPLSTVPVPAHKLHLSIFHHWS